MLSSDVEGGLKAPVQLYHKLIIRVGLQHRRRSCKSVTRPARVWKSKNALFFHWFNVVYVLLLLLFHYHYLMLAIQFLNSIAVRRLFKWMILGAPFKPYNVILMISNTVYPKKLWVRCFIRISALPSKGEKCCGEIDGFIFGDLPWLVLNQSFRLCRVLQCVGGASEWASDTLAVFFCA